MKMMILNCIAQLKMQVFYILLPHIALIIQNF